MSETQIQQNPEKVKEVPAEVQEEEQPQPDTEINQPDNQNQEEIQPIPTEQKQSLQNLPDKLTDNQPDQNTLIEEKPRLKTNKSFDQKSEKSLQRQKQLQQAYGVTVSTAQSNRLKLGQSQQFFRTSDQFDKKVVHEQINRSQTKQLYTFTKAIRFSKPKESYCSTQFYDSQLETQLGKRSAALGYGKKHDFTKSDKYRPGPTSYNLNSCFEAGCQKFKGVKFAFGREEQEKQGLLGNMNSNPGPGQYNPSGIQTKTCYSLGQRTNDKLSTTPAPGAYETTGLNPKGIYYVGKYKGSGAAMFSPTSSHLIENIRQVRQPGPGTYNPPGNIENANQNMPSQYLYQQGFQFGNNLRRTIQLPTLKTPGPGAYSVPSEFGDWDFPPTLINTNSGTTKTQFQKTDAFVKIQ